MMTPLGSEIIGLLIIAPGDTTVWYNVTLAFKTKGLPFEVALVRKIW